MRIFEHLVIALPAVFFVVDPPGAVPLLIGAGPRAVQVVPLSGIEADGTRRSSSSSSRGRQRGQGRALRTVPVQAPKARPSADPATGGDAGRLA